MAYKVSLKKGINIGRVVNRVIYTILTLWVGGELLTEIGTVIENTSSPLYGGLSIIGYTVGANPTSGGNWSLTCEAPHSFTSATTVGNNCVTATNGDGLLSVIGIIAIASIVLEFVNLKM